MSNSIEQSAATVSPHLKQKMQTLMQLYHMSNFFRHKLGDKKNTKSAEPERILSKQPSPEIINNTNFTGQQTDIAFAAQNPVSLEKISNVENKIIQTNLLNTYSEAVKDGYLKLENNNYSITEKGLEYINKPSFIEQFEKDQKYSIDYDLKNFAKYEFKGDVQDLDVFYYTDEVKLDNCSKSHPDFENVKNNFAQWEKEGYVFGENGGYKATEKLKSELAAKEKLGLLNKTNAPIKINSDSLQKAQQAANTAKATAETVKTSVETVKVAAETSTAAAGAATAGVSTAIQLSIKAVQFLSNQEAKATQQLSK